MYFAFIFPLKWPDIDTAAPTFNSLNRKTIFAGENSSFAEVSYDWEPIIVSKMWSRKVFYQNNKPSLYNISIWYSTTAEYMFLIKSS